jgi:hypothetical protein
LLNARRKPTAPEANIVLKILFRPAGTIVRNPPPAAFIISMYFYFLVSLSLGHPGTC